MQAGKAGHDAATTLEMVWFGDFYIRQPMLTLQTSEAPAQSANKLSYH